jgi:hypothetical protein
MSQLHLDVCRLPDALDEALAHLAAGGRVVLERDGSVVAELRPPDPGKGPGNAAAWVRDRMKDPPIDDHYVAAVEEAIAWGNRPAEYPPWE